MPDRRVAAPQHAHMPDAIDVWPIVAGLLAIVAAIGASVLAAVVLLRVQGHSAHSPPVTPPSRIASSVTLQAAPAADIAALRAEKARVLSEYAWVDRERAIVRIPIERAMELLASRGDGAPSPMPPEPSR